MEKLSAKDRLRLMKFVCSFVWADLVVHDAERQFVAKMVKKLRLSPDEVKLVEGWLEVPPPPEDLDPAHVPVAHRALFLEAARAVALADGNLDEAELENLTLLEQLLK
jgi:uncharacterized tellurite resistance protein B-like protein